MSKILFIVMVSACILYIFVGCFGYLTFAHNPSEILKSGGIILLSNYQGSLLIKIALLFICFSVIFTFPLYIKPTKEGLKELLIPKKEENYIIHFLLTLCKFENKNIFDFILGVVSSSLIAALLVKDMSDVLTLMGATINPLVIFHLF